MIMMPPHIHARLIANAAQSAQADTDHLPVVKYFNPCGAQTWLVTEGEEDGGDLRLFGLCDLGMGFPELGYVSFNELKEVKNHLGLHMERDLLFAPRYPLSVYAHAARTWEGITEDATNLATAASILGIAQTTEPGISPASGDGEGG